MGRDFRLNPRSRLAGTQDVEAEGLRSSSKSLGGWGFGFRVEG